MTLVYQEGPVQELHRMPCVGPKTVVANGTDGP